MLFLLSFECCGKLFFGGRFVLHEISLRLKSGEHFVLRIIQRRLEDGSNKHYTYEDTVAGNLLEETLRHKMQVAGLPDDRTLKISFATEYPKKKIKTIYYNGIGNRTSWCPVRIQGKPETKVFAWATGIGNSTGAGFGSIY